MSAAFWPMALGNVLGALVVSRSRRLALALGVVSVLAPLCVSRQWPVFRTVAAFGLAAGWLRVIQLARSTRGTTVASRVVAVTCLIIDPRRLARHPPTFAARAFATGLFEVALAVALFVWPHLGGYARVLVGACSAYFVVEGVARVAEGGVAAFGLDAGPFHDAPIRARTVGEFWSRRWNRAVHAWLNEYAFRPAARRVGVVGGVMTAFAASALLHAVPIWVSRRSAADARAR